MAALLVGMSVMAILMSAAMPAWRTLAQREKEAELIFRGEQYARAIALYQRRYGNASPPSLDVLVDEKFLRKKYLDPITGGEFQPLIAGNNQPGQPGQQGQQGLQGQQGQQGQGGRTGGAGAQGGRGGTPTTTPPVGGRSGQGQFTLSGPGPQGQFQVQGSFQLGGGNALRGGIIGVVSTSTDKSFRLYNGRDTYNQWVFMGTEMAQRAGLGPTGGQGGPPGPPGAGGAGGRGGPTGGRGPAPGGGRGAQPPPPGGGRGVQPPPGGGRGTQPQPGGGSRNPQLPFGR